MTLTFAPRVVACVVAALSLTATPALAVRYAAPSAPNTASCADVAHACSLTTAVNGRGADQPSVGEEVVVEPGTYALPGPLHPAARGEQIHGTGPALASIASATHVVLDAAVPTNLSTLTIFGDMVDPGGTLDRLYVIPQPATANHVSCQCTGGVLRDSVFLGGGGSAGGLVGYVGAGNATAAAPPLTEDYRNDTIVSEAAGVSPILIAHTGADASVKFAFTAENVILQPVLAAGSPATTVSQAHHSQTTTLTMTHSDVAGASSSTGGSTTNADASDIATAPSFAHYPSDLREVPGAPTNDAGVDDPRNGPADLDGNLRTSGPATDMGAYERQQLIVSVAPPIVITTTQSTLPIAKPKLKLIGSDVIIDPPYTHGTAEGRCTGVKLTCTVHGTLRATLSAHRAATAIGTIRGTLHPGHKGLLTVNLNAIGWDALYGAPHMRLDAKATVTTTSGLGTTKQTFTIRLQTEPDYT